jgi:hypothetical protein
MFFTMAWSLRKSGVPKPVTGSHPARALNPFVEHPGFCPLVISLKAVVRFEYRSGLRKPSVGLPSEMR